MRNAPRHVEEDQLTPRQHVPFSETHGLPNAIQSNYALAGVYLLTPKYLSLSVHTVPYRPYGADDKSDFSPTTHDPEDAESPAKDSRITSVRQTLTVAILRVANHATRNL